MATNVGAPSPPAPATPAPAPAAGTPAAAAAAAPAAKPKVGSGNIEAAVADADEYSRVREAERKVDADIKALPVSGNDKKAESLRTEAAQLRTKEAKILEKIKGEIRDEVSLRILEPNANIETIMNDLFTQIRMASVFTATIEVLKKLPPAQLETLLWQAKPSDQAEPSDLVRRVTAEVIEKLPPDKQEALLLRGVDNLSELDGVLAQAPPKAQTIILNSYKFKQCVDKFVHELGDLSKKDEEQKVWDLVLNTSPDPRIKEVVLDGVVRQHSGNESLKAAQLHFLQQWYGRFP